MEPGDLTDVTTKASLPVGVSAATVFGLPLNDIVLYGTALYLLCQFIVIAPKLFHAIRKLFNKDKG